VRLPNATGFAWHSLYANEFDNLNHIEIADEIQRQESKRAREWAGDE
jgi:hypothetical protein